MSRKLRRTDSVWLRVRTACRCVLAEFKAGTIDRNEAARRLQALESSAYTAAPTAEPDGDITYAVASTLDEIDRYEIDRLKNNKI